MQSLGSCLAHEAVLELNAGERASSHHCVVPSARAVRVELPRRQSAHTRVQILEPETARTTKKAPFDHFRMVFYRLLCRYLAAALTLAMLPAGEMWSVVT